MLSVEDFVLAVRVFYKIYQAERIPFQQRVNHGDITFPVPIYVVALVLGLDNELTVKPVKPFVFVLVVDEPLTDVAHCPVGMKLCLHGCLSLLCMTRSLLYVSLPLIVPFIVPFARLWIERG